MTPEVELPHRHHATGHRLIDMLVPLSALAISLISLGLAIHHGHIMTEMAEANSRLVAANSWPLLQYQTSNGDGSGNPAIDMLIQNGGVGPAKVFSVELSCEGRKVHNPEELLEICGGWQRGQPRPSFSTSFDGALVLRPGDSAAIIRLKDFKGHEALWSQLNKRVNEVSLQVCYCSVFDECWSSNLATIDPQRVEHCPVGPDAFNSRKR